MKIRKRGELRRATKVALQVMVTAMATCLNALLARKAIIIESLFSRRNMPGG
ncbi:hypothetical protein [Streptococcus jiangjianxini]|uniref:hypothetical protein n=1 Tax=Streptococcus jiangjianxini TaxID=3161189 RepID=UPI0032EBBF7B